VPFNNAPEPTQGLDFSVPDTYAESHISNTACTAGHKAAQSQTSMPVLHASSTHFQLS